MEIRTRPPITPPATATVVWVLIAVPVTLFWAPLVKPAPALEDSSCPDPVVVVVVAMSPTIPADVELDVAEDASDVVVGAKLSLVWVAEPSC